MRFDFINGQFYEQTRGEDQIAVIGTDRSLTWKELEREVDQIAEKLTPYASTPNPVLLYGHKEAAIASTILACLKMKIPYVPVDNIVPLARVQAISKIAQCQLTLCTSEMSIPEVPNSTPVTWTGSSDLAYIIFTSGSSGEPKGVQIQRKNVADLANWVSSKAFNFNTNDVLLNQCSFSFDVSFFDMIAALHTGGCLVLNSPSELKTTNPFAGRLEGLAPTVWSSTPSFLSLALTAPTFDAAHFPKLKKFYVAGEVVHANLVQRLWRKFPQGELWNAYGPTEATVITTLIHVTQEILEKYSSVPIGKVKPGTFMPTATDDKVSEGELWIIGDNISPGYLNRPDLNETRFAIIKGKRGYLTGDIGFHQDGLVFYKGRIDAQIKLHGYRIELDEIDNQAMTLPIVAEAATVGLRRDGDVKKLICFVKLKAGVKPEGALEEVRAHLSKHLPYYMVPADFRLVGELPYSANHKIDRGALAKQLEA